MLHISNGLDKSARESLVTALTLSQEPHRHVMCEMLRTKTKQSSRKGKGQAGGGGLGSQKVNGVANSARALGLSRLRK